MNRTQNYGQSDSAVPTKRVVRNHVMKEFKETESSASEGRIVFCTLHIVTEHELHEQLLTDPNQLRLNYVSGLYVIQ